VNSTASTRQRWASGLRRPACAAPNNSSKHRFIGGGGRGTIRIQVGVGLARALRRKRRNNSSRVPPQFRVCSTTLVKKVDDLRRQTASEGWGIEQCLSVQSSSDIHIMVTCADGSPCLNGKPSTNQRFARRNRVRGCSDRRWRTCSARRPTIAERLALTKARVRSDAASLRSKRH
jgi:hypothetical protein